MESPEYFMGHDEGGQHSVSDDQSRAIFIIPEMMDVSTASYHFQSVSGSIEYHENRELQTQVQYDSEAEVPSRQSDQASEFSATDDLASQADIMHLPETSELSASEDYDLEVYQLTEALESTKRELEAALASRQAEIDAHEKTRVQKQRLLSRVAELSMISSTPFDDRYFERQILSLRYVVEGLVVNGQWQVLPAGASKYASKKYQPLGRVTKFWPEHCTDEVRLKQVIEAYIWQYLHKKVFSKDVLREARGSSFARQFESVKSEFGAAKKDEAGQRLWHEWRVSSATILQSLSRFDGTLSAQINKLTCNLTSVLDGLFQVRLDDKDIQPLITLAIELDCTLRRQKALYAFYSPRVSSTNRPIRYIAEKMEMIEVQPNSHKGQKLHLDYTLAPGLCKRGNAEGKNYNEEVLLLKAQVLIDSSAPSKHAQQPQATGTSRPTPKSRPCTATVASHPHTVPPQKTSKAYSSKPAMPSSSDNNTNNTNNGVKPTQTRLQPRPQEKKASASWKELSRPGGDRPAWI